MSKNSITSVGRKKLASLGLSFPLLPTCAAGSLPKQAELTELRYRVSKGIQQQTELDKKERLSTEIWIRQQEKMGLDILVDGEMNRGDFIQHFAKKIHGFDEGGAVRCYGNRYYRRPIIKSKVEWKEHLVSEMWKYAQRLTNKPVKAVLTAPYTLMDWSFNEYYPSRESLCADLTAILRKEVVTLSEMGARIIQFDELALSSNPTEFSLIEDSLRELTRGIKAYIIVRHAFGNLEPIWRRMQKLPVDNFHLEMANSQYSFLPYIKKNPTHKDITVGLIHSHDRTIETPRELATPIKMARAAVPLGQLWLGVDSGLKTRTIEEAIGKLTALGQAALKQRSTIN